MTHWPEICVWLAYSQFIFHRNLCIVLSFYLYRFFIFVLTEHLLFTSTFMFCIRKSLLRNRSVATKNRTKYSYLLHFFSSYKKIFELRILSSNMLSTIIEAVGSSHVKFGRFKPSALFRKFPTYLKMNNPCIQWSSLKIHTLLCNVKKTAFPLELLHTDSWLLLYSSQTFLQDFGKFMLLWDCNFVCVLNDNLTSPFYLSCIRK